MRNIQDYRGKTVCVQVDTQEQYLRLVPLLNTIFSGWRDVSNYFEQYRSRTIYISLKKDSCSKEPYEEHETVHVSEFLKPEPSEVINTYFIF